jgi:retron-type reverse transcriptase
LLIAEFFANRPQFDIKILKKRGCWPITPKHYKSFTIKKRNGSERNLVAVERELKIIQSNFRGGFEKSFDVSKYAHAFISKETFNESDADLKRLRESIRPRGVITNALVHTNKKLVISVDLKDFFPTITFSRIMGMLKKPPYSYSNKQASIIAELTCLPKGIDTNRGLPQGAPTSPILSNLICKKLDYQLGKMAGKYNLSYSRYADDLTFSTNDLKRIHPPFVINEVTRHVERNGFNVNEDKTKIMYSNQRQMVTGIVVNDGLNLHKKHVDALRATLHNLEHNYDSVEEAIRQYWELPNKRSFDAFLPIGFYKLGNLGRFVKSPSKGPKGAKPIDKAELNKIYALHLLGRILWYGQVVTTAIDEPYNLAKHKFISPKQHARMKKYEELLASFFRIAMKYKWHVEHIVLRQANKLPHLQSLVKMKPTLLLEPILLDEQEQELIQKAKALHDKKEKYSEFVKVAPHSLARAIIAKDLSNHNFHRETINDYAIKGWPDPIKQKEVLHQFDTQTLSNLFHDSVDGYSVGDLLNELVKVVKPRLRYLAPNLSKGILKVHTELLKLLRENGDNARIDFYKPTQATKSAVQSLRDLKSEIRLAGDHADNFYQNVILAAVNNTDMSNLVKIVPEGMAQRMCTNVVAWRSALTKVLMSIKGHMDGAERIADAKRPPPYTIALREESIHLDATAILIYRTKTELPFKRKLGIDGDLETGSLDKRLVGGDISVAINEFLSIGDIFVHGNFPDAEDYTVNLTKHTFEKRQLIKHEQFGKLMFSLEEQGNQ